MYDGIELDTGKRWEEGTFHHQMSKLIFEHIEWIDFYFNNDSLGLSSGGDGDNGEQFMYLLDVFFERQDRQCDGGQG